MSSDYRLARTRSARELVEPVVEVPEPAAPALFGTAFAAFGLARRRRG